MKSQKSYKRGGTLTSTMDNFFLMSANESACENGGPAQQQQQRLSIDSVEVSRPSMSA